MKASQFIYHRILFYFWNIEKWIFLFMYMYITNYFLVHICTKKQIQRIWGNKWQVCSISTQKKHTKPQQYALLRKQHKIVTLWKYCIHDHDHLVNLSMNKFNVASVSKQYRTTPNKKNIFNFLLLYLNYD